MNRPNLTALFPGTFVHQTKHIEMPKQQKPCAKTTAKSPNNTRESNVNSFSEIVYV